jgi:hypothetical protein
MEHYLCQIALTRHILKEFDIEGATATAKP